MILWLDAHISPKLVPWIHDTFGIDVLHVRDLGLREAEDPDIFYKAREADAIVIRSCSTTHPKAYLAPKGRGRSRRLYSYGNGLISRNTARQRQRPAGQMPAVLEQVALHRVGKMATQNRNDLRVSSSLGAKPAQCLYHRCRRLSRPLHDAWPRMAEPDRSSVDLDRPRRTIRHV